MKLNKTDKDVMNWDNGSWQNGDTRNPAAEIVICSDWAPIRGFKDIILETPETVYGDLIPDLRNSDLRIVNLECPLVDNGQKVHKSGAVLKGTSTHIRGLTTVPFEVATLGNNHVFDYGNDAFVKTRDLLYQNSIRTVGAGMFKQEAEEPLILDINSVKIGIINFSEGEDLTAAGENPGVFGWDVEQVISLVRGIKSSVHAVIVICHAGVEYIPFPPPYVASAFQRIAASGADLIIGHHPHVPQGIQILNHVPICYSLGNFVFYQHTDLLYRKIGYFVKAGIADDGITYIKIFPYEILNKGLYLLKNETYRWFLKKMEAISTPLGVFSRIEEAWNGFIKYYGVNGFKSEIENIMDQLAQKPPKGAAMFRNRLTTMQHRHHMVDTMTRVMAGTLDKAPSWAFERVAEWFARKVNDHP